MAMDTGIFSKEDEAKQVAMERPHVVILGAGASLATFPNGDRTGRKLPLMDNLVAELGLENLIARSGITFDRNNFEAIYSKLFEDDTQVALREQIEIIDVKDEDELDRTWRPFIHTHHRDIHTRANNPPADFYDSWIANHPRRTGEAWLNQYCLNRWIEHNPVPRELGFEQLWDWFEKLTEFEK
jgi:hypothetical protein